jgi:hypothetical protein
VGGACKIAGVAAAGVVVAAAIATPAVVSLVKDDKPAAAPSGARRWRRAR